MAGEEWPKVARIQLHLPSKKCIFLSPGYLLFFLMLFVPTTYKLLKLILLLIIFLSIIIITLHRGRLPLHYNVLIWTLFVVSIGLIFIILGLFNGAPGALRVATVYVFWPMLFTLLASYASNNRVIRDLIRILIIAVFAISLYNLSYILFAAGWLPEAFYISIDQGQAIGFYEGYIEYNLYNISSLVFLIPFLIAALLIWPKDATPIPRPWIFAALIVGLVVSFLSARRALILIIFMSPIISLLFCSFLPQSIRRTTRTQIMRAFIIVVILLVVFIAWLQYIHNISLMLIIESIFSTEDISNSIRKEQFFALLDAWARSPLLGAGLGASVPGCIRSEEMPWAYELSYMALLFQTGLLGFFAYAMAVAWIFYMGLAIIRSGDTIGLWMLPTLVGMSCFLIANATNPYLAKFDYMWVIFLPIAFINFWLLNRNEWHKGQLSKRRREAQ
ncbi:MAG: hypothetical protein QHG98_07785 [Methanothrix sp.]|jgi:hypothetical protein|uniref:O-antigen ligase family protein n=1 Tax=Methanothrix sp. TaxID=90426 RepID=UPI00247C1870|nr:hypothetical protein [Methanothrix sp.]